jgi:hypothetical protein
MIRFLSGILLLFLAGCSPRHFIEVQATGVTLALDIRRAEEVFFASSLDEFRLQPITKNRQGVWVTNTRGDREFQYFYIVDGNVYVPDCRIKEKDDFGASNCIYQP